MSVSRNLSISFRVEVERGLAMSHEIMLSLCCAFRKLDTEMVPMRSALLDGDVNHCHCNISGLSLDFRTLLISPGKFDP